MCKKLIYLILVLSISFPAKAELVITNGDFEAGAGAGDTENVSLWYDDVSPNFWESAWELDREGVTPNGSMVVVFCSWNTVEGDPLTGSYVYQSIGTSSGESSVTIGFDWGHPDDADAGRLDGITIAAYASDGTTDPNDGVDINGAEGVTLLDSASYSHVAEGTDGEIFPIVVTLDLSGANAGDEIFLRFNNYLPEAGADPWPILDNVRITDEVSPAPTTMLIEDDFDGESIDLEKWQLLNGLDVSITLADGQVFFNRPQTQLNYLITTKQIDPAVTPLTIIGSAVTGPEGMDIWTRASNIGNTAASAQHVLDSGIRITIWPEGEANGWYDAEIIEETAGTWPWSGITADNIPGEKVYKWNFVVTDDGTTITVTWTQSDDPTNTFTLTATSTTDFDSDYIAFTVVNGYLNNVTITAEAPSEMITVENFSFELSGTEKIKGWNGEGVAGTPAVDIPGWSSDTEAADSGVETGFGATDGEWSAFLMGGDSSIWQLTNHVIAADDVIELKVDAKNNWQATTLQLSLYYDVFGIRVPLAYSDVTLTDEMQEFSLVFSAEDVPESAGWQLGVEFNNVTEASDSWIGLDNVRLMLVPPKPAVPVHSYTFEDGTANDGVGEAHGTLIGGAAVVDGAMVTTGQDQWMEMPGDVIAMNTYSEVTVEMWFQSVEGANTGFHMLAYFGDSTDPDSSAGLGNDGFFITSARGDDVSRAAISIGNTSAPWGAESGANGPEYDDGLLHHMVSTIDAIEITLYIDGELIASTPLAAHNSIAGISTNYALLAKGGYGADPEWIGSIEEFNIYDSALSLDEVQANYAAGPQK